MWRNETYSGVSPFYSLFFFCFFSLKTVKNIFFKTDFLMVIAGVMKVDIGMVMKC